MQWVISVIGCVGCYHSAQRIPLFLLQMSRMHRQELSREECQMHSMYNLLPGWCSAWCSWLNRRNVNICVAALLEVRSRCAAACYALGLQPLQPGVQVVRSLVAQV